MRKDLTIIGAVLWLVLSPLCLIIGFSVGGGGVVLAILGFIFGFAGFIVFVVGLVLGEKSIAPPPPVFNAGPGVNSPVNSYNPGGMPPPQTPPQNYYAQPSQSASTPYQNQQMPQNQVVMQSSNSSNDDVVSQIEKWGNLKEKGLITEKEFQRKKEDLLK